MEEIIKFSGSEDEDARDFLREVVRTENYRFQDWNHTLKTKSPEECNTSLFKDSTELPIFEGSRSPDAVRPRYAIAKVCVSTRDFLRAQALMQDVPLEEFKKTANPEQLESVKEGMREGHTVPIPVLEFTRTGEVNNFQEGRHRAVAALEMGYDYMPVFLAKEVR